MAARSERSYKNVAIYGQARAHLGDSNNITNIHGGLVNYGTIGTFNARDATDSREESLKACRDTLFLTFPDADRQELITEKGTRAASTCEWILENPEYQAWRNEHVVVLWVCGSPGRGKTMISIFLTEILESEALSSPHPKATIIYFFCRHQDKKRNSAKNVLRRLLWQLVDMHNHLTEHLLPYFDNEAKAESSLESPEILWGLLTRLTEDQKIGTVFCVLDGLDECDEKSRIFLMERLNQLQDTSTKRQDYKLRIVVLTRETPRRKQASVLRLDPENNEHIDCDIRTFVAEKIKLLAGLQDTTEHFMSVVQEELLQRAGGTFLWIGFAVSELLQKRTSLEVLETVRSMPRGLHDIYDRIIRQIEDLKRPVVLEILRWVALAAVPLHETQLIEAIGITPRLKISAEQILRDYIAMCQPIITSRNRIVTLIHESVRDYLLEKNERSPDIVSVGVHVDKHPSHFQLADRCIEVLEAYFRSPSCVRNSSARNFEAWQKQAKELREGNSLLTYAGLKWPYHAEQAGPAAIELLRRRNVFFRVTSDLRDWWSNVFLSEFHYRPHKGTRIHLASFFGIASFLEAWVSERQSISVSAPLENMLSLDENQRTIFHFAAIRGHASVAHTVFSLVARGKLSPESCKRSVLDSEDRWGFTALHYAAKGGKMALVKILLDGCPISEINCLTDRMETPVYLASVNGQTAVVDLLLKHGADADRKTVERDTALRAACGLGNLDLIESLVRYGADVDRPSLKGDTALRAAVKNGNSNVVKVLLHYSRTSSDPPDRSGLTALHIAAEKGHDDILKLMIVAGAHLDALCYYNYRAANVKRPNTSQQVAAVSALGLASLTQHLSTCALLLAFHADINAGEETPLQLALFGGNDAVVNLLLDEGADVNGGTAQCPPLVSAIGIGLNDELLIVRKMLDQGSRINATNSHGETALLRAAALSNTRVVLLLLRCGADVQRKVPNGDSALHRAASASKPFKQSTIQALLDFGLDINVRNLRGQTALHRVAEVKENEELVDMMLRRGGDGLAKDRWGRTPLDVAQVHQCTALPLLRRLSVSEDPNAFPMLVSELETQSC